MILLLTQYQKNEVKKVAAFSGNVDDESDNDLQRKIEKAIEWINE